MQPQETNSQPETVTTPAVPTTPVVPPPVVTVPVEVDKPVEHEIHTKKIPRQRHFLILFFFSFMWGTFGVDRMYMGLYGTGILKLLTAGGLGFWTLSDFIIIMTGTFKDKQGRVALQAEEYQKFASRTVTWFTIILAVSILLAGLELIFSISQLVNGGASSIPGLDQLTGGAGGAQQTQINSLMNQ